jgi:hypothetical protein
MADESYAKDVDGSHVRTLVKPIRGHAGEIKVIRLRMPRYVDIMTYGDPTMLIVVSGGAMPDVNPEIVRKYVETLCDCEAGLLEQIDYRDALALRDAVLGFFKMASAKT